MNVLFCEFKVYNAQTLKSVNIVGYFLIKDLIRNGCSVIQARSVYLELSKTGRAYLRPISIDRINYKQKDS
ncbi:hypothetical protein A1QO_03885 [Vibrio genomosp. F10 str. ZF-129]|uniref:Uncharacterized protein n=1 Tax=Vibrio genomosp. F10 str. ZF-129 TaxID=1187848 RepID=A0A1E5BIN0_9VIBR|nr:hypothetical protein A1QO_03885 [Vibrio genomosp. F10 str. ZF-129]